MTRYFVNIRQSGEMCLDSDDFLYATVEAPLREAAQTVRAIMADRSVKRVELVLMDEAPSPTATLTNQLAAEAPTAMHGGGV